MRSLCTVLEEELVDLNLLLYKRFPLPWVPNAQDAFRALTVLAKQPMRVWDLVKPLERSVLLRPMSAPMRQSLVHGLSSSSHGVQEEASTPSRAFSA